MSIFGEILLQAIPKPGQTAFDTLAYTIGVAILGGGGFKGVDVLLSYLGKRVNGRGGRSSTSNGKLTKEMIEAFVTKDNCDVKFTSLCNRIDDVKEDISGVKGDIKGLREEVSQFREAFTTVMVRLAETK